MVAPMLVGCGGTAAVAPTTPLGCATLQGDDDDAASRAAARARDPHDVPSLEEWREARAKLANVRRALAGTKPHTRRLALKLREPFTGRVMEARGAVALAPPSALRMILLGPGGTTALDLWVKGDRFRFAVPALDLLRRGDASTPRDKMRGLPVDFLAWWLLRPAEGTLLWYERDARADLFVIRDGRAVVNLCVADSGAITARRTTWAGPAGTSGAKGASGTPSVLSASSASSASSAGKIVDEETVIAARAGCGPVRYTQASTGLDIAVTCEGDETEREPSPRAFVDPDEPSAEGDESAQGGGS
jgi:hypothetical protein